MLGELSLFLSCETVIDKQSRKHDGPLTGDVALVMTRILIWAIFQ